MAIKAIGGILRSRMHPSEWESIEISQIWKLPQDDKNYILPSLLLSYDHLRSLSLKQCFAYCAIFPKDSIMTKDELIALWVAQGFLDKVDSALTLEKRGEKYIKTLLNNSFLQEEETFDIKRGNYTHACKMHDLVHDLALHISQNDLLVWKAEAKPDTAFKYRHLTFDSTKGDGVLEISMVVRTMNILLSDRSPY